MITIDLLVIKTYKELIVQMEATKLNIELYLAQREFVSVQIDEEKQMYLDKKIKAAEQYLRKIKKIWKELYEMIDTVCYSVLTDYEKIVFKTYFMDNLTAKEIVEKYPTFPNENAVWCVASKINKLLRKIPMKNYIPDVNKVLTR